MPNATDFKEAVATDLKWDFTHGVYILYLIDMATRYTKARVVYSKTRRNRKKCLFQCGLLKGQEHPQHF